MKKIYLTIYFKEDYNTVEAYFQEYIDVKNYFENTVFLNIL